MVKRSKKWNLSMYSDFYKFPNLPVFCLPATCLPPTCLPDVRPGSATCTGPIFLRKKINDIYKLNLLFKKRYIHCAMVIPFILHWPSLFFSKVSNSRKKVLIIPGLYFPNYCVTYLPRDISCDFNKCEHVNLRRE